MPKKKYKNLEIVKSISLGYWVRSEGKAVAWAPNIQRARKFVDNYEKYGSFLGYKKKMKKGEAFNFRRRKKKEKETEEPKSKASYPYPDF